jgi:S1-C subfamily serine protease
MEHKENIDQEQQYQSVEPPKEREGMKNLLIPVILLSACIGALFGFVAGGVSDKFFQKNPTASNRQTVQQERIIDEDSAVTDIVEKSSPAVVSIAISKNVPKLKYFSMPFGFNIPFEDQGQGSTEKQQIGGGTGFFASSDGMIVTNKHVVDDQSAEYTVITSDGKEHSAKVLARDPNQDIALIKIDGNDFPVLNLGDSDQLKIGQTVIAIGNSLGEFSNTVSRGIISGLQRSLTASGDLGTKTEKLSNIIQTDAAINPGNSGGPLIDISGNVIGINVAMAQGAQNIGFALPINAVKKVIDQVKQTGKISTPFLGVQYIPIDAALKAKYNLPFDYGVVVVRGQNNDLAVIPGGSADKAGIVENDIILELNGQKIDEQNPLADLIAKYKAGDIITLKIWHKGDNKEVQVTLQERKF